MNWFGKPGRRRLIEDGASNQAESPCTLFKERWKEIMRTSPRRPSPQFDTRPDASCCASFIVPGERIRRYPRVFYEDLQSVLMDEAYPDMGWECFEYIIYDLLGDEDEQFTTEQVKTFYDEADGLVHGRARSATQVEPDRDVLMRMNRCKLRSLDTDEPLETDKPIEVVGV